MFMLRKSLLRIKYIVLLFVVCAYAIAFAQPANISSKEAKKMIVSGFIEPITKQLPGEYAIELNRLIELEMEGSLG